MTENQAYIDQEQPNLSYIREMSGGDTAFEEHMINIIRTELAEEKSIYYENMQSKRYKVSADNVHKIKHKIGILGLEQAYQVAINYELGLLSGDISLQIKFESILNSMSEFINGIDNS